MKTKILFTKTKSLSLIFFLIMLLSSVVAESEINDNKNEAPEYYIIIGDDQTLLEDKKLNISAEDTLKFRIWDNTSKKFNTEGTIKIGTGITEIKWHDLLDKALDLIGINLGNNSGYYAELKFDEKPEAENYSVKIEEFIDSKGVSIPTTNKIAIFVESKYVNRAIGNSSKIYVTESIKSLNNRRVKYHKEKHLQYVSKLTENVGKFLNASKDLQNKISKLDSPDKDQVENLPVNNVLKLQKEIETSIEEFKDVIEKDELIKTEIKENLTVQIDSIEDDTLKVVNDLSISLNTKKDSLLKEKLENAEDLEEMRTKELSSAKSDFRNDVFYPAGALVLLGLVIGYFNVNRWKKESEYFGLYTSKAKIMSPITLAIIITIVISILIGAVVYLEGGLEMLKYLI